MHGGAEIEAVQLSADPRRDVLLDGRARTHDLIISIGPNDTRPLNAQLASEIRKAVNGGNGAQLTPQQ